MTRGSSYTLVCRWTDRHAWLTLLLCAGRFWQQTEAVVSQILAVAVPKVVKTPGFPAPYPYGTIIIALAQPAPGHEALQVLINGTHLPPRGRDGNCSSERLLLYDITPNRKHSVQDVCGNETFTAKKAGKVMVTFYSLQSNTRYSGFQIYIFAEKIFQEDLTIGLYFLFLFVSLAALLVFCRRQLNGLQLRDSEMPSVVHILPISDVRRAVVASGSFYAFQDDVDVRAVTLNSKSFRRFVRRASFGQQYSMSIIKQPIRNREDKFSPKGGCSPDADGAVPALEYVLKAVRYRDPQTPPADDDLELPQILVTPDLGVVGAWLPFVRANVAQKEREKEQVVQSLRPSLQLYYHSITETEQRQPAPPDFSLKPIYIGDGVISGLAQVEIGDNLARKKKKWRGNGDEPPWLYSRGIADKVMASHRLTKGRTLPLNCPCLQEMFQKQHSSETSLPADSSKQQLAHALSVDIRCISEERSLRPYWADPAKNLLEEPPASPSLPEETKPDAATDEKKSQGEPRPEQVKHARKGYKAPTKVLPRKKLTRPPREVKPAKPATKFPPATAVVSPGTKTRPAVHTGQPTVKSAPKATTGQPAVKSPLTPKSGQPAMKSALKPQSGQSAVKSTPTPKAGQPALRSLLTPKPAQPTVKSLRADKTNGSSRSVSVDNARPTGASGRGNTSQNCNSVPPSPESQSSRTAAPSAILSWVSGCAPAPHASPNRQNSSATGDLTLALKSSPSPPWVPDTRKHTRPARASLLHADQRTPATPHLAHSLTAQPTRPFENDWQRPEPCSLGDSEQMVASLAEKLVESTPLPELQTADKGCNLHTGGQDRDESGC